MNPFCYPQDCRQKIEDFVRSYFGEFVSRESDELSVLSVSPEGLPRCRITCGLGAALGCELIFSASESFPASEEEDRMLCRELTQLALSYSRTRERKGIGALVGASEPLKKRYGYSDFLLWPIGTFVDPSYPPVHFYMLIPVWEEEKKQILHNGAEGFVEAYHRQVEDSAFFHVNVRREMLSLEKQNSDNF